MSIFSKIKNVLFEEEEEEIPVITQESIKINEVTKEEPKKEEVRSFNDIDFEEEIKAPERPITREHISKPVEKTSPFQQFDEEEFDRIATINKNRLMERDRRLREEKLSQDRQQSRYVGPTEIKEEKHVEPPKRFTPSPVISPVYGILDKNYKKEDILPRASSDGTLPKVIDVDSVRKKAFGTLEEDIESINNDIEAVVKTTEIKITSFDDNDEEVLPSRLENKSIEELDSMSLDEIDEQVSREEEVKKKTKSKKVEDIIEEEPKVEDVKEEVDDSQIENDLIDLIDSMYDTKEEE